LSREVARFPMQPIQGRFGFIQTAPYKLIREALLPGPAHDYVSVLPLAHLLCAP
jgi:hypothetical protein